MSAIARRRVLGGGAAALAASVLPAGRLRAAEPLDVVATTGMIADAARAIAGDAAQVRALMGPGVDPHAFRQTRSDIAAMLRADLVLWHGLYLEAMMEDFLLRLAERRRVVAVAEGLPRDRLIAHDDYEDELDPHVWMDPDLWALAVARIREALIGARPAAAAGMRARAARYHRRLEDLAAYARDVLASVPAERRVLVTAHDAFNYFGRAYGFEVVGIQGISTQSEAGLARIEALVDLLVSRGIGAVFVESSVSERNIRALIEGAAARGHTVRVGGTLYSDAMGPAGSYEGTYPGMIDHNVTTIARALGGRAPAGGMDGRLALR